MRLRPQHHIVMIADQENVYAGAFLRGILTGEFSAGWPEANSAARLKNFLVAYPKAQVTVIANHAGQEYKKENLPRLNIFDRRKLIQRRLKTNFAGADLTAFLSTKTGKREILAIGITLTGALTRGLAAARDHHPQLGLLPIEGAGLLAALAPDSAQGWGILVTAHQSGGLRQIVTCRGELAFTRLTAAQNIGGDEKSMAQNIWRDIRASLDYLSRHGLQRDSKLCIRILARAELHPSLLINDIKAEDCAILTPAQAAGRLGLICDDGNAAYTADQLFAAWIARKPRVILPLRIAEHRINYRHWLLQRWASGFATAFLCSVIMLIGWQIARLADNGFTLYQEALTIHHLQIAQTTKRKTIIPSTEPLGRLRSALERRHLFDAGTALPFGVFNHLSAGLGSEARLMQLDWQQTGGSQSIQAEIRLTDNALASSNNRRQIITAFETATENIAQTMPGFNVKLTRYPFPALPQDILSNDNPDKNDKDKLLTAEIRITDNAP